MKLFTATFVFVVAATAAIFVTLPGAGNGARERDAIAKVPGNVPLVWRMSGARAVFVDARAKALSGWRIGGARAVLINASGDVSPIWKTGVAHAVWVSASGNAPSIRQADAAHAGFINASANASSPRQTNAAGAANTPLAVTDDSGATVALARPARRVVSLSPGTTELIYAAGGGAALVGAVTYSDYPPQAKRVPRVGDARALDLERIVALRPDLIVVWRHGNAQPQIDRLRALRIPLFFSEPRRLDDVASTLTRLGTLLGTQASAQRAAQTWHSDIARLRARYAPRAHQPPVSVFYQVWDAPLMTLNGTHIVSDVIALCGGRNVFATLAPLAPTVSTEAVLAANPEVIVAPLSSSQDAGSSGALPPGLARWRTWPALTAVARGNLFAIDGDLLNRPTPRLAQGAAALCADLALARTRRPASR